MVNPLGTRAAKYLGSRVDRLSFFEKNKFRQE